MDTFGMKPPSNTKGFGDIKNPFFQVEPVYDLTHLHSHRIIEKGVYETNPTQK